MKRILFFLFLLVSVAGYSQGNWTLSGGKNRWGNGMAFSSKSAAQLSGFTNGSDSILLQFRRSDSAFVYRSSPYAAWRAFATTDGFIPWTDTGRVYGYVSTAYLLAKTTDSLSAVKLNISDTASMLSAYPLINRFLDTTSILRSLINTKGTGTLTSIATNNGSGITGGTITTTGTLAIDTSSVISTKANVLKELNNETLATVTARGATSSTPITLSGDLTIDNHEIRLSTQKFLNGTLNILPSIYPIPLIGTTVSDQVSIDPSNYGTVFGGSINTTSTITAGTFSGVGTGLTGTASGLSIGGNAATVTNGIYTTSSFNLGTTAIALNRTSASQTLTGVSIDGNAGTATLAANSTLWNGASFNPAGGYTPASSDATMMYSVSGTNFRLVDKSTYQTYLGLGSNAYTSTAYLPTAGGTMGNNADIIIPSVSSPGDYGGFVVNHTLSPSPHSYVFSGGINGSTYENAQIYDRTASRRILGFYDTDGKVLAFNNFEAGKNGSFGTTNNAGGDNIISVTNGGATLYTTTSIVRTSVSGTTAEFKTIYGANSAYIGTTTASSLSIQTNGTPALTIDSSQAATFASTLSANLSSATTSYVAYFNTSTHELTYGAAPSGAATSGRYLPTITNQYGTSSISTDSAMYVRNGNIVEVSVWFSATVTSSTSNYVNISLPVASDIANGTDVIGTGSTNGFSATYPAVYVDGDASDNSARASVWPPSSSSCNWFVTFKYIIR